MTEAAACGRVVWTAGLLALGVGSLLLAVLPRDRESGQAGVAMGAALAVSAWRMWAACGTE